MSVLFQILDWELLGLISRAIKRNLLHIVGKNLRLEIVFRQHIFNVKIMRKSFIEILQTDDSENATGNHDHERLSHERREKRLCHEGQTKVGRAEHQSPGYDKENANEEESCHQRFHFTTHGKPSHYGPGQQDQRADDEQCKVYSSVGTDNGDRTIHQFIDPKWHRRHKPENWKLQADQKRQEKSIDLKNSFWRADAFECLSIVQLQKLEGKEDREKQAHRIQNEVDYLIRSSCLKVSWEYIDVTWWAVGGDESLDVVLDFTRAPRREPRPEGHDSSSDKDWQ